MSTATYRLELGVVGRGLVKRRIAVDAGKAGVTIESVTHGPGWLVCEVVWVFTHPKSDAVNAFIRTVQEWVQRVRSVV